MAMTRWYALLLRIQFQDYLKQEIGLFLIPPKHIMLEIVTWNNNVVPTNNGCTSAEGQAV